jgi:hydrogenase maturation protein HypF
MKTIKLPFRLRKPALACGADMKGAFALAKGDTAYLEDGFGDLADPDNLERYEKAAGSLIKKLRIKPKVIICDLHPGYFSTRFAADLHRRTPGSVLYKVQHHEAHIASVITDNAIKGDVVGVAFDGTGFGSDGNIWGGEFFAGNPKSFKREAHFEYMPMPGGEAAIKEPWRMAASYLYKAFGSGCPKKSLSKDRFLIIKAMIDKGINSPMTSSAGRLFDGAASLILGKGSAVFEAELPIALEKIAPDGYDKSYEFDIISRDGMGIIVIGKVMKAIVKDLSDGIDRSVISGRFHNAVADIITKVAARSARKHGLNKIVFSGGVFQNRYLALRAGDVLRRGGFKVYTHSKFSTTDAGLPVGQIAAAAARGICA